MKRVSLAVLCLLISLVPARGQTVEQQKEATIAYLRGLQTEEGGFVAARMPSPSKEPNPPSLRASTLALRALKYLGAEASDPRGCARFVERCFDRASGGFADRPGGKPDVISTAIALIALVDLKRPLDKYREPAIKYLGVHAKTFEEIRMAAAGAEAAGTRPTQVSAWLEQIAKMRNSDGTYGKDDGQARDTASAVVAVLRLGGTVAVRDATLQALNAGQRTDGGFGQAGARTSDLETTYRVMRAFVMLRARPASVKDLQDFLSSCRNADGGYGIVPGQPSSAAGTYFDTIIEYWLAEK
jgi:prenyltransferase beta subunit